MWVILAITAAPSAAEPAPAQTSPRRTPIVLAVEKATPSVVTVEVEIERQSPFLFGWDTELQPGAGSGVIIDPKGVVLTNAHVVDGAVNIRLTTSTGSKYPASIVAIERDTDLAVLQIEGSVSLPAITLGTSRDLLLGEPTIAIGNPLGLGLTVSTGVVSSVERDVEISRGIRQTFIQTDAAINPGNSGGALVNIEGKLIGINTAVANAEGIGFAIPIDRASKIAADLVAFGSVRAPWLGIELDDDNRYRLVLVSEVLADGPAAKALRPGDIIASIDGHMVASRSDLNARLASRKPGDTIVVGYQRDGRAGQVSISSKAIPDDAGARVFAKFGAACESTSAGLTVTAVAPGSDAARIGLAPGDVLYGVGGVRVKTVPEIESALRTLVGQHRAETTLAVRRGRYQGQIKIPL